MTRGPAGDDEAPRVAFWHMKDHPPIYTDLQHPPPLSQVQVAMSKDFIAFDPTGLDPLPPKEEVLDWIHSVVGDGQERPTDRATDRVNELVRWAGERYGSAVDENSIWTAWPPSLLADGRHCTFHLALHADAITFMMGMSEQCKDLGLLMIDPSGNDPFITIPGGGGLLD